MGKIQNRPQNTKLSACERKNETVDGNCDKCKDRGNYNDPIYRSAPVFRRIRYTPCKACSGTGVKQLPKDYIKNFYPGLETFVYYNDDRLKQFLNFSGDTHPVYYNAKKIRDLLGANVDTVIFAKTGPQDVFDVVLHHDTAK